MTEIVTPVNIFSKNVCIVPYLLENLILCKFEGKEEILRI